MPTAFVKQESYGYGATIEHDQLQANLDKALKLIPYLEADLNRFLENLSDDSDINQLASDNFRGTGIDKKTN